MALSLVPLEEGEQIMSLKERLSVRPVVKPKFEQVIDGLPEEERVALLAAAADPAWSTAALIRVLSDEGIQVSKETLGPWRNRVRSGDVSR